MANGWLPRNGEEWMRFMEAELRIQKRHRHVAYFGEWPDAIDGSSGVDTQPDDSYIDESPGQFVAPAEFTPEDAPPDPSMLSYDGITFLDVP